MMSRGSFYKYFGYNIEIISHLDANIEEGAGRNANEATPDRRDPREGASKEDANQVLGEYIQKRAAKGLSGAPENNMLASFMQ